MPSKSTKKRSKSTTGSLLHRSRPSPPLVEFETGQAAPAGPRTTTDSAFSLRDRSKGWALPLLNGAPGG